MTWVQALRRREPDEVLGWASRVTGMRLLALHAELGRGHKTSDWEARLGWVPCQYWFAYRVDAHYATAPVFWECVSEKDLDRAHASIASGDTGRLLDDVSLPSGFGEPERVMLAHRASWPVVGWRRRVLEWVRKAYPTPKSYVLGARPRQFHALASGAPNPVDSALNADAREWSWEVRVPTEAIATELVAPTRVVLDPLEHESLRTWARARSNRDLNPGQARTLIELVGAIALESRSPFDAAVDYAIELLDSDIGATL